MDIEGQKLRDTFLWNKNESMLAPEQFAEVRASFKDPDSYIKMVGIQS